MTNIEIAQLINTRIGTSPIPFDSVYSLCLQIYEELGGPENQFDDVYSILLDILPLTNLINDNITSTTKTWSSSKINNELSGKQNTLVAGSGITISGDTISAEGKSYNEGQNITIDSANTISADGYVYNNSNGSFKHYNAAHDNKPSTVGDNEALGRNSVVFGQDNTVTANGEVSGVIGGQGNNVDSAASVIIGGFENTISGNGHYSIIAAGELNIASGEHSFVTGFKCSATNNTSFASGTRTIASGTASHAEGWGQQNRYNTAEGNGSHVEGIGTVARNDGEHSEGQYNLSHKQDNRFGTSGNTLHTVGIGLNHTAPTNAVEVMQNGDYYMYGVGGYDGVHIKGENTGITVQTVQEYVTGLETAINSKQNALSAGTNISIDNNIVLANGYLYDSTKNSIAELYNREIQPLDEEIPLSQMGMSDLKFTGAANTKTYTLSGNDAAMFLSIPPEYVLMFGFKLSNNDKGYLESTDSQNSTVTFKETLDADNSLNEVPAVSLLMKIDIYLSGAANTTTYSYFETGSNTLNEGLNIVVDGFGERKIVSIDTANSTVTLDSTLNANSAVTNAQVVEIVNYNNLATGKYSHAEGYKAVASGNYGSHAEGQLSNALGISSHAEGYNTTANGNNSHAEGAYTNASGVSSHAEGGWTQATGQGSHAEGIEAYSTGIGSHAEGYGGQASNMRNIASGDGSHVEGCVNTAQNKAEHAEGSCNVSHNNSNNYGDSGNTLSSIGCGIYANERKNAREIMQNGDCYLYGVGNYDGVHIKGEVSGTTVQTLQEVINSKADVYETATTADIEALFA